MGVTFILMLMPPEIKALDYRVSGAENRHQVAKKPSAFSASLGLVPCTAGNLLPSCQDCLVKLSNQGVAVQVLNSALVHTYICIYSQKELSSK